MRKYINKHFSILLVSALFFSVQGFAQESFLLKELRIPQILQENPGLTLPYDAHVSFPGLGKVHVGVNAPFSYGDMFSLGDKFLKKRSNNNAIRTWFELDPIHLGFRVKEKNYISITTAVKTDINFAVQKDLFALVIEGNEPDRSLVKNNLVSANAYMEFGLGYNREVNDNVSFGVNAKYLLGFLNAHTKKADLTLTSGENFHELVLNQNLQGKISCISDVVGVLLDSTKETSDIADELKRLSLSDFKNHGFSIDLGMRYKINDYFEVTASVLDLGLIKWKSNPYQYDIVDKPFTFRGYESDNIFEEGDGKFAENIGDYFQDLADSLLDNFKSELVASSAYTKWLNTKINVGFSIYASPKDRFNLAFKGTFINSVFVPSGSVSYVRHCGKWFDVVVGNTFKPKSLLNPGLGVNFTLGVFQLYAIVDYTNTLAYIDRAKNLNVIFGINFVSHRKTDSFKASYPY